MSAPDRSDRLDHFYKYIFRIVGAVLLAGGLWMFAYYRSATTSSPDVGGGQRAAGYQDTIRQAREDERRFGSILGATGAGMGVVTLVTAELLPRIRRRGDPSARS